MSPSTDRSRRRWLECLSDNPSNGSSNDPSAIWSTTPRVCSSNDIRSRAHATPSQGDGVHAPTKGGNTSSAMYHGSWSGSCSTTDGFWQRSLALIYIVRPPDQQRAAMPVPTCRDSCLDLLLMDAVRWQCSSYPGLLTSHVPEPKQASSAGSP